jgi:hypothetical protein
MPDVCPQDPVKTIAQDLNSGQRDVATNHMSACNADLALRSDYARTMQEMGGKVMSGDPVASKKADGDFATLANQERDFWKSIQQTARESNPAGLCQLSIVERKSGPQPEIDGDKCN